MTDESITIEQLEDMMVATVANILAHFNVARDERAFNYFREENGNHWFDFRNEGVMYTVYHALRSIKSSEPEFYRNMGILPQTRNSGVPDLPNKLLVFNHMYEDHCPWHSYQIISNLFEQAAKDFPPIKSVLWEEYLASHTSDNSSDDSIIEMFDSILKLRDGAEMRVVGTHNTKGKSLPIIQLRLPNNGTIITVRDNYYDICVSVDANYDIQKGKDCHVKDRCNIGDLFDTTNIGGFFDGFPKGHIFGPFDRNPRRFSMTFREYPSLINVIREIIAQDDALTMGPQIGVSDPPGKAPR